MHFNFVLCLATAIGASGAESPIVEGTLESDKPAEVEVAAPREARNLSVLVTLKQPGTLPPGWPYTATVQLGAARLRKNLHVGDPDVLWTIRQPRDTVARITLHAEKAGAIPVSFAIRVVGLGETEKDGAAFETEPNDRPEEANPLTLGQTIYGLADDRPYLPLGAKPTEAEQSAGVDWFRFDFEGETPKLAYFALDFVDRDVPPDVRIYRLKDGTPVEYTHGIDPQSLQRERPPRPGANKFTTRVLTKGTYYVLVDACQPDYQLRTKLFDVPPYLETDEAGDASKIANAAHRAVRSAMDFQLLAGDSWHANTPRKGHPMDRVANPHHETSTCIACHPTHFTTQSALTAVRYGYKVAQPFALEFLTDRLANNPVPFHGHPGALWARMIPAPANVMGRLSTMLMDFENLIDTHGTPRDNTHAGIAEFLKLYYDSRDTIPPDESNGNNPVSRYKVATDSWRQLDEMFRRTKDPRYAETRDRVARLLPMGTLSNTRDLAAQTIGLCLIGKEANAEKVEANVRQLLSLQRPNGHWSVKFDPDYAQTEMQTGESLYALSLAGLPSDHPALLKGAAALLVNQKEFGGWFDVSPYEQFRTPFRETQWALMALSRLYPGPDTARHWNDPLGPHPETLRTDSTSHLLDDLERVWGNESAAPEGPLSRQLFALLDDPRPIVRYAACRALERVSRSWHQESAALYRRLGDESKVVQRAAALALRTYGNRLNARDQNSTSFQVDFREGIRKPLLGKCDDRTRRGATRIFAAHFRDLSKELTLAVQLLTRLDDSDPVVQMQAVKGLWRWWYWRDDIGLRNRIEDQLIAKLAVPTHPWVRRNVIEALYIIGDENIRYLYTNWVPALATQDRRDRATAAQHATVNRLAEKYIKALDSSNALQREGILRALSEFPDRPGRIGNDTEPMLVYDDMVGKLSAALTRQMSDPDPTIRRLALQALVADRNDRSASLSLAVMTMQGDADAAVRDAAGAMAKEFPLKVERGKVDPAVRETLTRLLENGPPEAIATALAVVGRTGPVADDATFSEAVHRRLDHSSAVVRAAAFRALAAFAGLQQSRDVRDSITRALADHDPDTRAAALALALAPQSKIANAPVRKALDDATPAHRIALLGLVGGNQSLAADLRLIGVIAGSLDEEQGGVREKTLQVIQARPALVNNPAVEEGLRELTKSSNLRHKEIATALLKTRGRSSGGKSAAEGLDLAYFEARVLPIFNESGEDGQNCVGCHRSHTILRMVSPGADGRWSPQAVRANFLAALRVVNLPNPSASLLLNKPTWEAAEEAEAQNDPSKKAHAGGVRFEKGTREYQALLDWINGARLPKP